MPGFDRTGPRGEGPRTGWGTGRCHPAPQKKVNPGDGDTPPDEGTPEKELPGGYPRGLGRGPGMGRGGTGRGSGRSNGRGFGRGRNRWRGGGD